MKGTTNKASNFLTKYAMVIALVIVFVLFAYLTDGRLLYAQNMSNLMLQNGYVLVMACGMLLCILTGAAKSLSWPNSQGSLWPRGSKARPWNRAPERLYLLYKENHGGSYSAL